MFEAGTLIIYTVQDISNSRTGLADVTCMRPFSKIVCASYPISNRTWNFFEIYSRREDCFAIKCGPVFLEAVWSIPEEGRTGRRGVRQKSNRRRDTAVCNL